MAQKEPYFFFYFQAVKEGKWGLLYNVWRRR